jgi:isopropylmalate/homocitrate/citramalate synthase
MTPKNIALEPEILERAEQVAATQGKSVDELANEAMKRELARLFLERIGREAQARRGNMTDDEVDAIIERAIAEDRAEQRTR